VLTGDQDFSDWLATKVTITKLVQRLRVEGFCSGPRRLTTVTKWVVGYSRGTVVAGRVAQPFYYYKSGCPILRAVCCAKGGYHTAGTNAIFALTPPTPEAKCSSNLHSPEPAPLHPKSRSDNCSIANLQEPLPIHVSPGLRWAGGPGHRNHLISGGCPVQAPLVRACGRMLPHGGWRSGITTYPTTKR
jgi:hypothetical protein